MDGSAGLWRFWGDGEACIFEVDKKGFDGKVITVAEDEIEEKISK